MFGQRRGRVLGREGFGQLGNGTTTRSATAVPVSGLSIAVAITAGGLHSCASGFATCWGNNRFGQLGNGTTTNNYSTRVAVSDI